MGGGRGDRGMTGRTRGDGGKARGRGGRKGEGEEGGNLVPHGHFQKSAPMMITGVSKRLCITHTTL